MKEIWKDIKGYEGLYQVSNLGKIKSLSRKIFNGKNYYISKEKILKPAKDKDGYVQVLLYKNNRHKTYKVHRLVAMAFIPNPNNLPQINHKDENKQNNRAENLEWCTNKYNCNYGTWKEKVSKANKGKIGLRGSNSPRANKVKCITTGETFNSLIEAEQKYNIKYQNISACCRGKKKTAGGYRWEYIDRSGLPIKKVK